MNFVKSDRKGSNAARKNSESLRPQARAKKLTWRLNRPHQVDRLEAALAFQFFLDEVADHSGRKRDATTANQEDSTAET